MLLKTRTLQAKNTAANQDDYSVAPARSGRSQADCTNVQILSISASHVTGVELIRACPSQAVAFERRVFVRCQHAPSRTSGSKNNEHNRNTRARFFLLKT